MNGSLTVRKITLHQASECFDHVTLKRNLSAESQSLTNTVCICLWWNRAEQMGVGTCVHAYMCVCVCVCVCVCDDRDKVKNEKCSYFDCFFLLCRLCKMCVSLLVQTPHLLGMYRGWGFIWESMVFTDPEL